MVLVLLNAAIEQLVHARVRTCGFGNNNRRHGDYGSALRKLKQGDAIEESVYSLLWRVKDLRNSIAHDALFEPPINEITEVVELLKFTALQRGEKYVIDTSDLATVYIAVYVIAHNRLQGAKFANEQSTRILRPVE